MDPESLAETYCQSCHLLPDPSDLDSIGWEKTFVWMRRFMGLYTDSTERNGLLGKGEERRRLVEAGVFPVSPMIDPDHLEAIKAWYLEESAKSYRTEKMDSLQITTLFNAKRPDFQLETPSVTLLEADANGILLGDVNTSSIVELDFQGKVQRATTLPDAGAVSVKTIGNSMLLLNMGSFSPTDSGCGNLVLFENGKSRGLLIKDLQRPVDFEVAKLDDGPEEQIIVAEFGKWTGGLSLYVVEKGTLVFKEYLDQRPGAMDIAIVDWDNDGFNDVLCLFGQAAEGMYWYRNLGGLSFERKELKRFKPSFGSSGFSLTDINGDSLPDILYTNGDNADVGNVLKSYHGIRAYAHTENHQLKELFFQPMQGAYDAQLHDFDQDGDLDLFAISFFPAFGQSTKRGALYFENKSDYSFAAHAVDGSPLGRWIRMHSADYDGDGDEDVLIGSLLFEVEENDTLLQHWQAQKLPYLLLENQLRP